MTPISHPVHRPGQRRRASGKRTEVCTAALSLVLALGLVLGPGTLPSPAQVRTETGQDKAVRDGTAPARQQILRGSVDVRASLRNDAAELSLRHSDSPHDAALDREVFRPEDVCLGVPDRARRERTGPLMSSETEFLGTEGEKFYELPQEPDQDLVSLTLDTSDVDYSELSPRGRPLLIGPGIDAARLEVRRPYPTGEQSSERARGLDPWEMVDRFHGAVTNPGPLGIHRARNL